MHTVTFYSFKGGVGRTLALVNIGVELSKTGRKVLLVDFDLEAPGIDTFSELAPADPCRGIVDYVTKYLTNGSPPDFAEFHYKIDSLGYDPGGLWVMPAGRRDGDYGAKLAAINWPELYSQRDGYLLIEHLKDQWKESISPDYVLIDSRTGHTEVGGICTRQLPDTVVVLFIPNEQNLDGVSSVVEAIREENAERKTERADRRDAINIELVASNVPSLDDEYQILRKMMRKFEGSLIEDKSSRRGRPITTIERYDSMHLLNQSIFVIERPQSRLTKQYRFLMRRIVEHNLEDREAALREITEKFPRPGHAQRFSLRAADFESIISQEAEKKIQEVLVHHADDAEINFMIGQVYKSRGDLDQAQLFFLRAAQFANSAGDPNWTKYQLEMIETLINQGKTDDTLSLLLSTLKSPSRTADVSQAIGLLARIESTPPVEWIELPAFESLTNSDVDSIAWNLSYDRKWQGFATALGRKNQCFVGLAGNFDQNLNLVLAAIGSKNYDLVLNVIEEKNVLVDQNIRICFNYAMAKWGKEGRPDPVAFSRVLSLDEAYPSRDPNYEQCLALTAAVVGDLVIAKDRLRQSCELVEEFMPSVFSCWRYLRVNGHEFMHDLDELRSMIEGQSIQPEFMR